MSYKELMDDRELRIFLDLLMVSDPWPLEYGQDAMTDVADAESRARGYDNWIDAYHKMNSVNANHAFSGSI